MNTFLAIILFTGSIYGQDLQTCRCAQYEQCLRSQRAREQSCHQQCKTNLPVLSSTAANINVNMGQTVDCFIQTQTALQRMNDCVDNIVGKKCSNFRTKRQPYPYLNQNQDQQTDSDFFSKFTSQLSGLADFFGGAWNFTSCTFGCQNNPNSSPPYTYSISDLISDLFSFSQYGATMGTPEYICAKRLSCRLNSPTFNVNDDQLSQAWNNCKTSQGVDWVQQCRCYERAGIPNLNCQSWGSQNNMQYSNIYNNYPALMSKLLKK